MTRRQLRWPVVSGAGAVGMFLFCVLLLTGGPLRAETATAAPGEVQQLAQAQGRFMLDGWPPEQRMVDLPLHWDIAMPGRSGRVELEMAFERAVDPAGQPWTVLIPRLGNAWRVAVNGHLLQQAGVLDAPNASWSAKRPVSVQIPAALLRQHNILTVSLRADIGRRAGLSRITVGPAQALRQQWLWQELIRVHLPQAASVLSLLVAVFALLLWWQQREQLYAVAAVGELVWALRLTDTWWEDSPLGWPAWGLFVLALFWIWSAALYLLVRAVWDGARPRWEQAGIATVIVAGPLAFGLALWQQVSTPVVVWMVASQLAWWWLVLRLSVDAWRAPQWARWLLVVALAGCMVALARDIYAGRASAILFEEPAWSKYAAVTMALLVLLIVSMRFKRTREDLLALNRSIQLRIADRERELHEQHLRVMQLESEKAAAAERARILRDMHDGAGAHLIAAIRQVESGDASRSELLQTLGDSLDQLRLSVDAMGLPAGDINALLANLRFRLDRRIRAAGLRLVWRADLLPALSWCGSACMHHIQYILLEAISNAMQHAHASALTMTAITDGDAISIELSDDGRGLDGRQGNGLRSMRERAALIPATLALEPAQPGLRVRLRLPFALAVEGPASPV